MKQKFCIVLIAVSLSSNLSSQNLAILQFSHECMGQADIGYNPIKSQVYGHSFEFKIYSIELLGIAGCSDDSAFAELKGDTLFLDVLHWQKMVVIEGDTMIEFVGSECSCNFYLTYDIYGLQKEPKYIKFGNESLEVYNFKYNHAIRENINGELRLIVDDCGFFYEYWPSEGLERGAKIVRRYRKNIYQKLTLDKNDSPIKIETSVDYGDNFREYNVN